MIILYKITIMDFTKTLLKIKNNNLYRYHKIISKRQGNKIIIAGKKLINFCSNDYLSLADNIQVKNAYKKGIKNYGVGAGASHLVSGHSSAHQQLAEALSDYTGQQRTLLFSSGYSANLGVFLALKDELDWVLQDKLNHASLIDANHLINLPLQRYAHNNIDSLQKKILTQKGNGLIVTDNVFSMDGDIAQINAINKIIPKNSKLMQDDAHGFGIFKANIPKQSIYMATLGKAAATMGAFVAGDEDLIELLIQKSRPYIYTTALPPSLCMATLKSLEIIKKNTQTTKLMANITFFKKTAKSLNIKIKPSKSAIQPLIIGSNEKTLIISNKLYLSGFYVSAIRPPTVPTNSARLRITLTAGHTKSQIKQLLIQIKNVT